ncbi:MAG: TRAP transporter small permease [Syntrophales bacterium]|nr:TRAP transporter small permease [Syntrophales bacterium]
MLERILRGILSGMALLAGLLLLFVTFSISYNIATRALGYQSPLWTVQFNEYSLLWITFLGSAWVLSRRKHVSMDVVIGHFKPRAKRIAETVHSIMGIVVCGVLCWYSAIMTFSLFQRGVIDVQAVDVPKYLVIVVIPIGFIALTIQFVRNLILSLRKTQSAAGGIAPVADPGEAAKSGLKGSIAKGRVN